MIQPGCGLVELKGFKDPSVQVNVYYLISSTVSEMPIVLPSLHIILPKESPCIGQLQSSLMWFISSWFSRGGLSKSYMSTIPKLMCVATPKNPWAENTSFQAGIKHNNPSAHPILLRSMLVYLYPKETRRMPLQNLVSFLWINSNNPLTSINHYIIL